MANNDTDEQIQGTQDAADESSTTENTVTDGSSLIEAMKADPELNGSNTEDDGKAEDQQTEDEQTNSKEESESEDEKAESNDEDKSENEDANLKGKTRNRIQGLASENRALKDRIAELEGQRNVPHTVEDYVEAGYSEAQAAIEQMREENRIDKENLRVAQLNANMHEDGVNAEHDYPIFDEKSPEYDKDFAEAVSADYRRYANLQTDPSGQYIVNASIPLYDFYKSAAERYERGMSRGRTAGAEASAKQFASAEQAPSSRPAPKSGKESDLDLLMKGMRSRLPS